MYVYTQLNTCKTTHAHIQTEACTHATHKHSSIHAHQIRSSHWCGDGWIGDGGSSGVGGGTSSSDSSGGGNIVRNSSYNIRNGNKQFCYYFNIT